MRALHNLLQDLDIGFLRIIAEHWGFDPPQGSLREAAVLLSERMLDLEIFDDFITSLPPGSSDALYELVGHGGSAPLHNWQRKHGEIRVMGAGRRDREQPWREAISPSELLWYRGLVGRAFVDTPKGAEEVVFLPTEVYERLQVHLELNSTTVMKPIAAPAHQIEPAATIIDDCTTILAALRRQTKPSQDPVNNARLLLQSHLVQPESLHLCLALLKDIRLLGPETYKADLEAVRDFLLADRMQSLRRLYITWKESITWNDFAAIPSLRSGSDTWPNDPTLPREILTGWLKRITVGEWYSPSDLVRAVYQEDAAFQRPGGNFNNWYLLDSDGIPLDGIEHWYAIEGALLHSILKGPLHWFGVVQLGLDQPQGPISGFAPTKLFNLLENMDGNLPTVKEQGKAMISSDGFVTVPRSVPRSIRYQLARFLEWEGQKDQSYTYRLSIRAIQRARQQDLHWNQVRSILTQASGDEVPPPVLHAMQRLEDQGYEAAIEAHQLLRVSDPSLLKTLLSHKSTKRYIHEKLSDTTAIIRQDHWKNLVSAAVSLGILIDGPQG